MSNIHRLKRIAASVRKYADGLVDEHDTSLGSYWLDPHGNIHRLPGWGAHEKWMRRQGIDANDALRQGWHTVVAEPQSGEMTVTGHLPLNRNQADSLWNVAKRHRTYNATHEMIVPGVGVKRRPIKFTRKTC